ncbi:MAG: non-canonical purine NTP pyrophosphatase [Thermoanaerobaculia bacterium]|nr:non-canonical purine NTP pyrophosphatase [Thermoanaerobaculia bacterium]
MAEAHPGSRRGAVLVTGNPSKLAEARRLFPRLETVEIDLPEIQSLDLHQVLSHKARAAAERVERPVVVEETGLELPALGGFPGPLVKWMLQAIGPEGIARLVAYEGDTRATARCALLYLDGETEVVGEGHTRGELVLPARGDRGFGWDPVFRPEGSERTYGEMLPQEKDAISHRGRAWRAFQQALVDAGVEL